MTTTNILAVTIFLLFLSLGKSDFGQCNVPKCRFVIRSRSDESLMNRFGKSIPTKAHGMFIDLPENATKAGCYIDLSNVLDALGFTQDHALGVISFHCKSPLQLFLTEDKRTKHDNVILYLQIITCTVNLRQLQKVSNVIDVLSFVAHEAIVKNNALKCLGDEGVSYDYCSFFQNSSVIWYDKPPNHTSTDYVFKTLNCSKPLTETRELSMSNMKWKTFPEFFQTTFPNVQALEIPGSELTVPPSFPWNDGLMIHSRNISRGSFFQEQYAETYHISDLEVIHHRRLLNLNRNKIKSLVNFTFSGLLHMLQLEENGLEEISGTTFENLRSLQHLDLSSNKLKSIPDIAFRNLTDLRHLNLGNNLLTNLQEGLLDTNIRLMYLNAANNNIKSLGKKVFAKLLNLTILHLEFNSLIEIDTHVLPIYSVKLKVIHLNNNPLEVFPQGVFYIRKLEKVYLEKTRISFRNFTSWLYGIDWARLVESVGISTSNSNLKRLESDDMRMVDLSESRVENLFLDQYWGNSTFENYRRLRVTNNLNMILTHFRFLLNHNPLTCDCRIVPFNRFMKEKISQGVFNGNEYMFTDWKCTNPKEFDGKIMLNIAEEDTYCVKNLTHCPPECTCHERSVTGIIIVDCVNTGMENLPASLPDGVLDLWFQDNNITSLSFRPYLSRVRQMILANNAINTINLNAIKSFRELEVLSLTSNHLSKLPEEFRTIKASKIMIKNNPFTCDCNTLWMKAWLFEKVDVIEDSLHVACNVDDDNEHGKLFTSVPDNQFICKENFDSLKHVVVPSIVCSIAIALLVVCSSLLYVYRLEVKVLLYIYFGIHPFDKDEKDCNEEIDVVIVHSPLISDWVLKDVVEFLEKQTQRYVVCEMMRDFVAGFSYQENIACMVKHSRRMLLVLSKDMVTDDDLLKVAWNEAQEKIKELRTNYAMIVCYDVSIKEINNKDLRRYVKRGRYIDVKQGLFHEKIMYCMPQYRNDDTSSMPLPSMRSHVLHMYGNDDAHKDVFERHAFIAYSDQDMGYTMNDLRPKLEEKDYTLCLPDRDFIPGASKEENVLKAVDNCMHTLFLLSGEHLQDEWSLFTFRSASEKSLRDKCNHLIVLTTNDTDLQSMDEEVRYYIKTHVTLNVNDDFFFERLLKALPFPGEYQPNLDGETNFVKFQNMMNEEINLGFDNDDEKYIKYENEIDHISLKNVDCDEFQIENGDKKVESLATPEMNGEVVISDTEILMHEQEHLEMQAISDV